MTSVSVFTYHHNRIVRLNKLRNVLTFKFDIDLDKIASNSAKFRVLSKLYILHSLLYRLIRSFEKLLVSLVIPKKFEHV